MAWLTGWGFRKEITVQDTNIDGALTDFPVLVKLTADEDIGDEARADGYDIRFTQSDGETLLKYQREYWTGGAGDDATAVFWVKSNLAASGGATIYLYYGKADAGDGEDAANTWNANFLGVWHLSEAVNTDADNFKDSSGNSCHGQLTDADSDTIQGTGKIYKCVDFNGDADYITITVTDALRDVLTTYAATLSFWANHDVKHNDKASISWNDPVWDDCIFYTNDNASGNGGTRVFWRDLTGNIINEAGSDLSGEWHYHTFITRASDDHQAYRDIVSVGTSAATGSAGPFSGMQFGGFEGGQNLDGKIEEVRVSDLDRGDAWIKFEYNNVNEADNELTWGNEEAGGVTLVVADSFHTYVFVSPALTQKHTLALQDSLHAHVLASPALTQKHILALEDVLHSMTFESPTLIQHYTLVLQDVLHALTFESPILTQKHTLDLQDMLHSLTFESPVLTQKHVLALEDMLHALTLESPVLTQKHILVLQDVLHALTFESPVLTQKHILGLQDVVHSLTFESPVLTQKHSLVLQDMLHAMTLDSPTLITGIILVVADILHEVSLDSPVLTQKHTLILEDILHTLSLDIPSLTQKQFLDIQDILYSVTLDTPSLIYLQKLVYLWGLSLFNDVFVGLSSFNIEVSRVSFLSQTFNGQSLFRREVDLQSSFETEEL